MLRGLMFTAVGKECGCDGGFLAHSKAKKVTGKHPCIAHMRHADEQIVRRVVNDVIKLVGTR